MQSKSHMIFLPKVEINDYNTMINAWNVFHQPIKSATKTYGNIRKITAGQENHHTTGCLLDYPYITGN